MMQTQEVVWWWAVPLLAVVALTASLSNAEAQEPAPNAGGVPEAVAPVVLGVAILVVGIYPAVLSDVFGTGIAEILPRLAP